MNWIIDPKTILAKFKRINIDRPIFFVGNQGGGLTLISRMIRRHPSIVSISGNHEYWTGADEMQRVMVGRLPKTLSLSGKIINSDPKHNIYTLPRSWSYGVDDLIRAYHMTEESWNKKESEKLKRIIWEAIYRFSNNPSKARFVDKSQSYTLKMRYIESILEQTEPYFVLITREPVAACYRAASGKAGDMERYSSKLNFDERLDICIQHWYNCMSIALEDGKHLQHFQHFRFEDFLSEPENSLNKMCNFIDLSCDTDMIPQPYHEIPFGTRYSKRWYPLKEDINEKYYKQISDSHKDRILDKCASLANELGYNY